ncbi:MAG TPA: TaqI-like C-terminal specificity domain-containing protein, partial [Allocoleopsis sp.]
KRELERLIKKIKASFSTTLQGIDPQKTKLRNLEGELYSLENTNFLFEESKTEKKAREKQIIKLQNDIDKLRVEIEEIETGKIYQNAFEWRFEFPEVLNDQGDFVGFDVIIGNPPYGVSIKGKEREHLILNEGKVPDFEIYYWFINKANTLLKDFGRLSYIIPNSILFNVYAQNYRIELFTNWHFDEILDCTDFDIFLEATVKNTIINLAKIKNSLGLNYRRTDQVTSFQELINSELIYIEKDFVLQNNHNWGLLFKLSQNVINMITKIKSNSQKLINLFPETSQGLIAYDKYKNQSDEIIKNRSYHSSKKLNDNYKLWLDGEDVTKYHVKWNGKEYINYCDQIANPREPKYFIGKRILVREITNPSIFAALTSEEMYNDPSIIIILDQPQKDLSLECLLGILNSKFATFYHFNSSPKATKGAFPKILVYDINNFPIPKIINTKLVDYIEKKVNKIINIKSNTETNTSELEREIGVLVYELYGLTEEEIRIIEGERK